MMNCWRHLKRTWKTWNRRINWGNHQNLRFWDFRKWQGRHLKIEIMEQPKSYCEAVERMDKTNVHRIYHDQAYGFPIHDENELFERLVLEINQEVA